MTDRSNPYTQAALGAVADVEQALNEVLAELLPPLGTAVIPASTRRGRMKSAAQDLAELLLNLARECGADHLVEVLGLPAGEGGQGSVFESLVGQYGEEVVGQAMSQLAQSLQEDLGTPVTEQFLPSPERKDGRTG